MSMVPAGPFNSQVDPDQIARRSFVSSMYGMHTQRGPLFYPQSPYALGDIAPMSAMQPIDDDTLFTTLPAQGTIALSTAPIGSAGFPTFQAMAPTSNGTVLGPSGATVPELSAPESQAMAPINATYGQVSALTPAQAATTVASSMKAGGAPITGTPAQSYTSPYGNPAATLEQAGAGWGPAGPITFTNPWPSMVKPADIQQAPVQPSLLCELGTWVNQNPALSLLGAVGVYLFFKGGKKR
jgi:hypothetical protein